MGVTLSMSAAQVVLLLILGTATAAPQTDREKQNRVVAVSKSEGSLLSAALSTALTVAKVELLRTALNAPTNAAILEVALTLSTPELLTAALQDATVENLIVALTAADGTVGTSASLLESLRSDASGKSEAYDESDESNEYDDAVESNESDESDESGESDESDESEESDESNELESQNIVFQKASESSSPVLVAK